MKTTIYELLGMIKDGKAPKKIKWKNKFYYYDELENDYVNDTFTNDWIFENLITNILNDEVEILDEPKEEKIEKLDQTLNRFDIGDDYYRYIMENRFKINEIIEVLNER